MFGSAQGRPGAGTRVSIIIPCRDGERYVAETLRSVLGQGHDDLEIIVVDDGSTDRTAEAVRSFGDAVRYVRQDPGGASVARNRGVGLATGDVLAFLDADDLWCDQVLPRMLSAFDADPSVGMVVGQMEQFVSPDLPASAATEFRFSPDPVPARMCGTVLVRRSEFDRVGGFSPELSSGEFIDWLARAEDLGVRSASLPDVVLRRRLHRLNHGVVRRESRQDYLRVVKAALDRRRASAAGPEPS